ncbi:MAG: S1-C subfamily serine protease [Paracoccaceae bacterium]
MNSDLVLFIPTSDFSVPPIMRILPFLFSLTLVVPLSAQLIEPPIQKPLGAIAPAPTIYDSVVKIEVATQVPDYRTPWNSGRFSGGTGTGFIIGPNQILTNAHVVSDNRRLLVTRRGSSQKHVARVLHVAHDCDLALIELEDFKPFEGLPHLQIGGMPKLESRVSAIGYPVGGERLSVTQGVVSRIDFSSYSHSRADSHLVIQIDAAINPGNSGGPVVQDGKVVGVAFQGNTQADNVGYIIPTPVVKRFLKDIEDGQYDHYMDIGITPFPLFNPAMRRAYKLPADGKGVLVANVVPAGPADGVLERGDVLLSIDGNEIDSAGNIRIAGEFVDMNEIVERKFEGDKITLTLIRKGTTLEKELTLKEFPYSRIYAIQYEKTPRYSFFAGLVFQPLDLNLFASYKFDNRRLRQIYADYVSKGLFREMEDVVVLTRVESDRLTTRMTGFSGLVVEELNGTKIKNLRQLHELLNAPKPPEYHVIKFNGASRPLVIPSAEVAAAQQRIMTQVGITKAAQLD